MVVKEEFMIRYLNSLRKMLANEECHPDWGSKRVIKMEKRIELKEKRLEKRKASKPRRI
jgi:hypothetical protein